MRQLNASKAIPDEMRKIILDQLNQIEKDENVQLLFAIESGSRAWGFPSPDSDYDVRFVYVRPLDWYLTIGKKRDVIELPIDRELDTAGWDIQKALTLLIKPNPVMLEWLSSPIRYIWDEPACNILNQFAKKTVFGHSCLYHYLHLGERQYKVYVEGRSEVKLKKYLYIIRPALAIRWLRKHPDRLPPMNFQALCNGVDLPKELENTLEAILEKKRLSKELGMHARIPVVDTFTKKEFTWAREKTKERQEPRTKLLDEADELFRQIVKDYDNNKCR